MSPIHVCNPFFERELETLSQKPLADWMRSHPAVLQLQFLPLLYAEEKEPILVSDLPNDPDPRLRLIDSALVSGPISDWGPSLAIRHWAEQRNCAYSIPPWETVRQINSKIFSFLESPRLPGSALLENAADAQKWIEKTSGPKVLKTAFGTAGGGHFHIGLSFGLDAFLKRQFEKRLPVIGEPWVERLFDFSTQWKDGRLLGATAFENEPNGTYKSTLAGPPESIFGPFLWALEEHLAIARPLVEKLTKMEFSGHFGLDAYVYQTDRPRLQPIVEINGRKTMSWAALQIQQKKCPGAVLRFSYSRSKNGLLPSSLTVKGKQISFTRNVSLDSSR